MVWVYDAENEKCAYGELSPDALRRGGAGGRGAEPHKEKEEIGMIF